MTENNFKKVLQEHVQNSESSLSEAVASIIAGDSDVTEIDPKAPIDFYDPALRAQWVTEMSRGTYGMPSFRSVAEMETLVKALPLTDVDMIDFLYRVAKRRIHVASQNSTSLLWLLWGGRYYNVSDEAITSTIIRALTETLVIVYDDVVERSEELTLPVPNETDEKKKERAAAKTQVKALKSEIEKFIKHCKSDSGHRALKNIMLGREGLVFKESDHSNDDQEYIIEADGRMRHVDNLDVLLDPDPSILTHRRLAVNTTDDWVNHGLWDQFLLEVFGDPDGSGGFTRNLEKEMLAQEAAASAIMGTGRVKYLINIVGPSNAGKSLYLNVIKSVFGEYGWGLTNMAIVKTNGTNFYQDEARGKRLVYISEPDEKNVDEPYLKALTGGSGETLTTAQKGKLSVTWSPQCFLHIMSNSPIKFDLTDDAMNRRILTVSVVNSVERDDPRWDDRRAEKIVAKDLETVYRWILDGARRLLNNGYRLTIPDEVAELQEERSKESSSAVAWAYHMVGTQELEIAPKGTAVRTMYRWSRKEYAKYTHWCVGEGLVPMSSPDAKEAIEKHFKKPGGLNTKKQDGYPRVWGLLEGPKFEPVSQF